VKSPYGKPAEMNQAMPLFFGRQHGGIFQRNIAATNSQAEL
jgi:hypothetical protein